MYVVNVCYLSKAMTGGNFIVKILYLLNYYKVFKDSKKLMISREKNFQCYFDCVVLSVMFFTVINSLILDFVSN